MTKYLSDVSRIAKIIKILLLENIREPSTHIWSAVAPCILFALINSREESSGPPYLQSAAWFYSYISANIAFFGFSHYLIGRRESGFIRSFIYQPQALKKFIFAHYLTYSAISVIYSTVFYLITKPLYGSLSTTELAFITTAFYSSFLLFSCIGLIVVALPLKFSTASTLFSAMAFLLLFASYIGASQQHPLQLKTVTTNPLWISTRFFDGSLPAIPVLGTLLTLNTLGLYITFKFFRTQPVWSRY